MIFNALIIILLIPLALRGVRYRPRSAARAAAREPADLRSGRTDRAVHRHQADRHDPGGPWSGMTGNTDWSRLTTMGTSSMRGVISTVRAGFMALVLVYAVDGSRISGGSDGPGTGYVSSAGQWQPDHGCGRCCGRVALIGQEFNQPQYFWGRLSATGPVAYNAAASSGSNLGPLNPDLIGPERHGAGAHRTVTCGGVGGWASQQKRRFRSTW